MSWLEDKEKCVGEECQSDGIENFYREHGVNSITTLTSNSAADISKAQQDWDGILWMLDKFDIDDFELKRGQLNFKNTILLHETVLLNNLSGGYVKWGLLTKKFNEKKDKKEKIKRDAILEKLIDAELAKEKADVKSA